MATTKNVAIGKAVHKRLKELTAFHGLKINEVTEAIISIECDRLEEKRAVALAADNSPISTT